jgi:adenosylmethionine-8-amino-7-oxononanoate aminotransferase
MSATLTTDRIWEAFLGDFAEHKTFYHGHTYGGNPLAAAAGLAVLDLLEGRSDQGRSSLTAIAKNTQRLQAALEGLKGLPFVGDIKQLGMMSAVELVADKKKKSRFDARLRVGNRVCQATTQEGLWLRPLGDVIPILPAVNATANELDWLAKTLHQVLSRSEIYAAQRVS